MYKCSKDAKTYIKIYLNTGMLSVSKDVLEDVQIYQIYSSTKLLSMSVVVLGEYWKVPAGKCGYLERDTRTYKGNSAF